MATLPADGPINKYRAVVRNCFWGSPALPHAPCFSKATVLYQIFRANSDDKKITTPYYMLSMLLDHTAVCCGALQYLWLDDEKRLLTQPGVCFVLISVCTSAAFFGVVRM